MIHLIPGLSDLQVSYSADSLFVEKKLLYLYI
jgi:hypothetical protein